MPHDDHPILVLEDEMLIALDIQDALSRAGHCDVVICSEPQAALDLLERTTPRFALLDVNLGRGETSFGVARALAARGCPFAFLSGYADAGLNTPHDLSDVPQLSKPFDDTALLEAAARMG